MGITKTIGGNRVGSGKKMQAHLHNYFRSTHNLSEKWASSMGSGILYPAMCKLAMRGDTFDIAINADARTIPTKGPLFGSYKMQIDVYQCPIRLYQALLHNNPLAIGLNMAQIKFPILTIEDQAKRTGNENAFSNSCLLKYLGLSGLGSPADTFTQTAMQRSVNAIPALAYYDIFKTYYANKQEETGYVICPNQITPTSAIRRIDNGRRGSNIYYNPTARTPIFFNWSDVPIMFNIVFASTAENYNYLENNTTIQGQADAHTLNYLKNNGIIDIQWSNHVNLNTGEIEEVNASIVIINVSDWYNLIGNEETPVYVTTTATTGEYVSPIHLQQFDLSVIDDMRYDILSHHTLGTPFELNEFRMRNKYPYYSLVKGLEYEENKFMSANHFAENGLVIKTYQNDIFNNWLNAEWIEGENGIAELSKVEVVDGAFTMDQLSFAQKMYNMLNRIAIAGATYEDWQDVVYEEVKRKQIESPIYCGGMSQEVYFDEIVQTSPADNLQGEKDPLGTLGGRGRLSGKKKGGKLHIKCDEACFIIAIVSLTPRVYYTQGNEFYMTDVLSMDDIHKPPMDGIGFQDLIGERLAFWDTQLDIDGNVTHRSKVGKLPAWMEYMTSIDHAYGDFAELKGKGYMILNRNYECENYNQIKDATTYIDPAKYNYAFAYTELEAQNFWVQINFDIKARRLMSARLIPNV